MSPIDPRLPLMGVPPPNPAQAWQDAQNLALGQQRLQLGRMALQQEQDKQQMIQRAIEGEQRANQIVASLPRQDDGTIDTSSLVQRLAQGGVPLEEQERLTKSIDGMNTVITSYNKAQKNHKAEMANAILQFVPPGQTMTPELAQAGMAVAKAAGMATDKDEQQLTAALAQGIDPDRLLKGVRSQGDKWAAPPKFGASEGVIYNEATGEIVGGTGKKTREQLIAESQDPTNPNAAQAARVLERLDAITPEQQARLDVERGNAARMAAAQAETARHNVIEERQGATRLGLERQRLAQTAPGEEITIAPGTRQYRIAQDLAAGTLSYSDFNRMYGRAMGNAAMKAAIYDTARQLNPSFSPVEFELGQKMAGNPQIRQRIVAISSLGPVIDRAEALSKQVGASDVPALNKLILGAKFQLGNQTVTNFRQLQTLLGDEVGNALGVGSGSDLKTKLGLDLVNPNLGPAAFASTMEQLRMVLNARKQALAGTMGPYSKVGEGPTPTQSDQTTPAMGSYEAFLASKKKKP